MTNAVLTETIYYPPQSVTGLINAVASAWVGAGLGTLIDSWSTGSGSNTTNHRTFEIILNNNATKGKCYFDIYTKDTTTGMPQTIMYDGFNTTSHAGTNGSQIATTDFTSSAFSFTSGEPIIIKTVSHPELKILNIKQGSAFSPIIGIFRPSNIPAWWNENSYLYAFSLVSYNLLNFSAVAAAGSGLNSSNSTSILNSSGISLPNSLTRKRDFLPGLTLMHPNSSGMIGKSSNDLIQVAASGLTFGDTLSTETEKYTLITYVSTPGIAIRTA